MERDITLVTWVETEYVHLRILGDSTRLKTLHYHNVWQEIDEHTQIGASAAYKQQTTGLDLGSHTLQVEWHSCIDYLCPMRTG